MHDIRENAGSDGIAVSSNDMGRKIPHPGAYEGKFSCVKNWRCDGKPGVPRSVFSCVNPVGFGRM